MFMSICRNRSTPIQTSAPTSFDLKLDALMTRKRELSRGLLIPGEDDSDTSTLFDDVLGGEDGTHYSQPRAASAIAETGEVAINSPPEAPSQPPTSAAKEVLAAEPVETAPTQMPPSLPNQPTRAITVPETRASQAPDADCWTDRQTG